MERFQKSILIAGAGPVGLALALELARRGLRPRLVAKADGPTPPTESRALGVNERTLTLLEASGASALILARARRIDSFRISSGGKRLMTIDTTKVSGRYRPLCVLPQGDTESILIGQLARHGISPEWQTEVEHVTADADNPAVTLKRADGTRETVKPDILVGADGAHSTVRECCGFTFPGDRIETPFFLADYRYAEPVDAGNVEIDLLSPGIVGCLPVREDTLRYISTRSDFETLIVHPAGPRECLWSSKFQISFRHVEEMRRGRVFLAGDAAHIHSPVGARGMNLGIEDACWLAWLIDENREKDYSSLRMPAVEMVVKQTRRNTALITLKNPVLTGLRRLALPLLGLFPAATRAVLANAAGRDTTAPPWIPNPK